MILDKKETGNKGFGTQGGGSLSGGDRSFVSRERTARMSVTVKALDFVLEGGYAGEYYIFTNNLSSGGPRIGHGMFWVLCQ